MTEQQARMAFVATLGIHASQQVMPKRTLFDDISDVFAALGKALRRFVEKAMPIVVSIWQVYRLASIRRALPVWAERDDQLSVLALPKPVTVECLGCGLLVPMSKASWQTWYGIDPVWVCWDCLKADEDRVW